MTLFQIGDRIQGGLLDNFNTGTVVAIGLGGTEVLVAWDSADRDWTPVGDCLPIGCRWSAAIVASYDDEGLHGYAPAGDAGRYTPSSTAHSE